MVQVHPQVLREGGKESARAYSGKPLSCCESLCSQDSCALYFGRLREINQRHLKNPAALNRIDQDG